MAVPLIENFSELFGHRAPKSISFHHHLRNGDHVLNMALAAMRTAGLRDLALLPSSVFPVHAPLVEAFVDGTVTSLRTNYMSGPVADAVSRGALEKPALLQSHGGRARAITEGEVTIDLAILASPACDRSGNATGALGPSACGPLGYGMVDAAHAKTVVLVTDHLCDALPIAPEIPGHHVDAIIQVPRLGDPAGLSSGTTQVTRDPVALGIAEMAARVIEASGLMTDGISFQTGAGGASLAVSDKLGRLMRERGIVGSFISGGVTGHQVQMLRQGLFKEILDVQAFDAEAVTSFRDDAAHRAMSAAEYASPAHPSPVVDRLDVMILGAAEIDRQFNINVVTGGDGRILGGSGGHADTAAGAKLSICTTRLTGGGHAKVVGRVRTISTPGKDVDVLVTEAGIAVNPARIDLIRRLRDAKLPVVDIHTLIKQAERISKHSQKISDQSTIVAHIEERNGQIIDEVFQVTST